jgi:hypothetical protein
MSVWSASIGNNVRRAGSSSLPRPHCHFELQHGPAPNIAHSFFASSESHSARVGTWAISSAVAEQRTVALPQLSFCYFACPTLSRAADARQKTRLWGVFSRSGARRRSVCFGGITTPAPQRRIASSATVLHRPGTVLWLTRHTPVKKRFDGKKALALRGELRAKLAA